MMTFTNKLAVVAFTLATSTAATGAAAACTSGCLQPTPTGSNSATNNTTVGVNAAGGNASNATNVGVTATGGNATGGTAYQTQGQQQQQGQTLNNSVNTTGTVGAINTAGGSSSIATGAVQINNRPAASSALAAGAYVPPTFDCTMSEGGFGFGVQVIAFGVNGNKSGKSVWNDDSKKCDTARAENAIIGKGGTPAADALAAYTAAEKSPDVVGKALKRLSSKEGQDLKALFGAAQTPVIVQQAAPVVAGPSYNTTNIYYPATQKATELCANGKPKVVNAKTGLSVCPNM